MIMDRPKRKITLCKKYSEKEASKDSDSSIIPCIFCLKPVDSKNHFIFEQSNTRLPKSDIPQVCDSPLCLARLISSRVCKTEIESEPEDDDEGFIGFSNDANSTENWFMKLNDEIKVEENLEELIETEECFVDDIDNIPITYIENVQTAELDALEETGNNNTVSETLLEILEGSTSPMKTSGLESMQFNDEDEDEEHVVNKEEMEIFFDNESVYEANNSGDELKIEYLDVIDVIEPWKYLENIEIDSLRIAFENMDSSISNNVDQVYCIECSEPFNETFDLITHIVDQHALREDQRKLYHCTMDFKCEKFASVLELNAHILMKHLEKNYQVNFSCFSCFKEFENKSTFNKHMCQVMFLDESLTKYECEVCQKKLPSRRRLLFHHQFHIENARPKICLICLEHFEKDIEFYNHVMFAHENPTIYFCDHCDREFELENTLNIHKKSHFKERNYVCGTCGATFLEGDTLECHFVKNHSKVLPYTCEVCGKGFSRHSRYQFHLLVHQKLKVETIIACKICELVFHNKPGLVTHFKKVHPRESISEYEFQCDRIFCCQYCERLFKSTDALQEHRKIHEDEEDPFQCEYCPKKYPQYGALKSHLQFHAALIQKKPDFSVPKHYLCHYDDCLKSYNHYTKLSMHLRASHCVKVTGAICNKVTCSICGEQFLESWRLAYHKKKVHPQSDLNLNAKCSICSTGFRNLTILKQHQITDHKDVLETCEECSQKIYVIEGTEHTCITCNICKRGFLKSRALTRHMQSMHSHELLEDCSSSYCPICKQKINLMSDNLHICQICDECGQSFSRKLDLERHYKAMHLKTDKNIEETKMNKKSEFKLIAQPGVCQFCMKSFATNTSLRRHIKSVHNGIKDVIKRKNYKCNLCEFTTRCQSYLDDHLISHSEERPHICAQCGQAFKRFYTLLKHEKRFHNNKSLKCDQCEDIFTSDYLLSLHKNKHVEGFRKRKKQTKRKTEIENNEKRRILQIVDEEIVVGDDDEAIYAITDSENDTKDSKYYETIQNDDSNHDEDNEEEIDDGNDDISNEHSYIIQRLDNVKDPVKVAKLNQSPKKISRITKVKNLAHFTKSEVELAVQNLLFSDSIQVQSTCEIHSTEPTEIDVINP